MIQIVTRKGRSGKTQWRAYGQLGTLTDPTAYPSNYFTSGFSGTTGTTAFSGNCILDLQTRGLCRADQTMSFNPLTFYNVQGTGHTHDYGASASGGGSSGDPGPAA